MISRTELCKECGMTRRALEHYATDEGYHLLDPLVTDASGSYYDDDAVEKRAYSSYLEIGYDYTFDNIGLTLGAQIGMVPWACDFYSTESFAVKNLSLKINKAWEFDACELDLFAQGMIDTHQLSKENAFIKANTGEKLYGQKLNGCIGLGIWF